MVETKQNIQKALTLKIKKATNIDEILQSQTKGSMVSLELAILQYWLIRLMLDNSKRIILASNYFKCIF